MADANRAADLVARARTGDQDAFEALVTPHRHELHVHCYRLLASTQDAEDVMQEVLLAAWRGIGAFEERSSIRTWLYRIATNRCLNHLRGDRRRPDTMPSSEPVTALEPTRLGEVFWLEPFPDLGTTALADPAPGPEARYQAHESISLAFVAALQLLTPRQRAALILRDALGFSADETASILQATTDSANGALKRARAVMRTHFNEDRELSPPESDADRTLVERFTGAYERGDVGAIVGLLTEDVWLSMPPFPMEYQGPQLVGRFFASVVFRDGRRFQTVPTRANGQPAFAAYERDPSTTILRAHSLLVLTTRGARLSAITRFDPNVFARFGLPRTLPR